MVVVTVTMSTPTCLDDAHSSYLHLVLEKKMLPDDMKILDIRDGDECTPSLIRRQYLKLSRIYHPDKCIDGHANELFLLVSNSFNKLASGTTTTSRGTRDTTSSSELTLKESLLLFIKVVVGEYCEESAISDAECDMLAKMVLSPEDLTWNDKLSLTCTIYKLFINKK